MLTSQCTFTDLSGSTFGGIYVLTNGQVEDKENDYIICGCCGAVFHLDEVESWSVYHSWIDISKEIIGE